MASGTARHFVLHHDYGGDHGAGGIRVISLKPEPHVILELDEAMWGQKRFEKDSKYGVVLSSGVYRFAAGDLQEVTPEYCAEIQSNTYSAKMQRQLSPQALRDLKDAEDLSQEDDAGSVVLSLIVQDIFCRQFQNAYDKVRIMWPERDRPHLIKNLQQASRSWQCPECTKAIDHWQ